MNSLSSSILRALEDESAERALRRNYSAAIEVMSDDKDSSDARAAPLPPPETALP